MLHKYALTLNTLIETLSKLHAILYTIKIKPYHIYVYIFLFQVLTIMLTITLKVHKRDYLGRAYFHSS